MESAPTRTLEMERTEAGAGAMLLAYRLAGLSALRQHYARVRVGAQFGPTQRSRAAFRRFRPWRCHFAPNGNPQD